MIGLKRGGTESAPPRAVLLRCENYDMELNHDRIF